MDSEKIYEYKFSVVIPIYNVENYLQETIESVINQDIGFEDNIQMILVNDGSPDNSEDICLKYKNMFPENIIYVKQKNSGVSAARNTGMKYITGKYVNFLDSDDKWSLDAFSIVYDFFDKNRDIEVVACRKKFFEADDKYHILDLFFGKDKKVDIFENYNYCHLHAASSFIKSDIAKKYKFSTHLKYGEDAEYINKIILNKGKYGISSQAIYNYRKRLSGTSAIQNTTISKEFYIETVKYFHCSLIEFSIQKYNKVIPYIQYVLMYDLQWRIKREIPDILNDEERKIYKNNLIDILQYIDDYIICEQKNIYAEHRCYALCLKYQRDIRNELDYRNSKLYFKNIQLYNLKNPSLISVDFINVKKNKLYLEGRINCILPKEDYSIYVKTDTGKKYNLQLIDIELNSKKCLDGILYKEKKYKISLPIEKINEIRIMICYKNTYHRRLTIGFKKFSKLNNSLKTSYFCQGKYVISTKSNKIFVEKKIKGLPREKELTYLKDLKSRKLYNIIFYRIMYKVLKKFIKKKIWLISDRENKANDNGEHLFKYIVNQKNNKIKPYFLISKESEDYKRIKKIGKVIKANTIKHKLYFLMSSKIISSQANEYVINPFEKDEKYLRDLIKFDFVFLQHGITKDDLSVWLNKFSKNIKIFVTAGKPEYESIINGNYEYSEAEVKLTGFPRHDKLITENKQNKKKILIIPTWRKNIQGDNVESVYLDAFKNTEFFKFYNDLINDERLINALKQNGYICKFCLHPLLCKQWVDFTGNDYVEINEGFVDYQKEFMESSLLITDYSSVFFDFAYLKKPIIYSQFDLDTFFAGQAYEVGYFDYEKDGFGPVCYNYEKTVEEIVNLIKKDCALEEKYLKRIVDFYGYTDNQNCQRVYEEILKLK